MTDRLPPLLRDAAERAAVPPARPDAVLRQGRLLRRRRRRARGLAAGLVVAVVAVVAVGAVLGRTGPGDRGRAVDPAGPATTDPGAVFSIGPRVYLQDGRVSAVVDDVTVKSLYYTSAGVLVRHGLNNYSDGGGPQRFSLVRPDGTVSPVGVETEETVHATDPAQPYLAWAQRSDGAVHVLVRDVDTDQPVADVTVPGVDASYLPVSLDGDQVYLGDDDRTVVVDWRTGAVDAPERLRGVGGVAGGRALVSTDDGGTQVVDVGTGEVLATVPGADATAGDFRSVSLSPDGRHGLVVSASGSGASTTEVLDVADGSSVPLSVSGVEGFDLGWTQGGALFAVVDGALATCDPDTGSCSSRPLQLVTPPGDAGDFSDNLQLGGRAYES